MRRKLLGRLQDQLDTLFEGLSEAKPRQTGMLSAARLKPAGSDSPGGWVWESDPSGQYSWVSPEVNNVLGVEPEEVIGQLVPNVGFDSNSAERLTSWMDAFEPIENVKLNAVNASGQPVSLLVHALVRTGPAGEFEGYRGVSQVLDISRDVPESYTVTLPHETGFLTATTAPPLIASWGASAGYQTDGDSVKPLQELTDEMPRESIIEGTQLTVPIVAQDRVLGMLAFEADGNGTSWEEEDQEMVESVAQQLALALQDARSYQLTQQALDEMREADQLKAQFLANMSHELRTPLNSIIGFSRVILKGIDGPVTDTQEEDLQAIYSAGQHLLGLINDILDLSKIEAGKMELAFNEIDMGDIIEGVMSTAIGLVRDKPIELIVDVPDDLPLIEADNIRVRQILLNLISNAAKFTEEGRIETSARIIEGDSGEEIMIAVSDTGLGIPESDHDRLFIPFSQVDSSPTRRTEGSGLGLSITKHLVDLHRGKIWVESTVAEGSTFVFTLPVRQSINPAASTDGDIPY